MYIVKNHADMYRLWRHLYETGNGNPAWVHGFKTDREGFVTLDDYYGKISEIFFTRFIFEFYPFGYFH